MAIKRGVFISILFSILLFCNTAEALRKIPEVKPLIYYNIRYTANIDTIEAWDIRSDAKLWELQVYKRSEFYRQKIKDELNEVEPDLWIYIDSLRIEEGNLIVGNEAGDEYVVDLQTKEARKRIGEGLPVLSVSR